MGNLIYNHAETDGSEVIDLSVSKQSLYTPEKNFRPQIIFMFAHPRGLGMGLKI